MQPLLRLGAWGGCAIIALSAAVYSGTSRTGEQRVAAALASFSQPKLDRAAPPAAEQAIARATAAENEAKRLAESVRQIAADRDRLTGRLASLERNFEDITGSIAKASGPQPVVSAARPAAAEPGPPAAPTVIAAVSAPETTASAPVPATSEPAAATANAPGAAPPVPRRAPLALIQSYVSPATSAPPAAAPATAAPEPARGDFAVDLGGAGSVDALRTQWGLIKSRHAALFDGLQPLVLVRSPRPGATERRLIVGPLANPTAVARICAALSAAGTACAPAVYDGQKLALR